jgi:SSS family solute:Na+ symporter
MVSTRTLIVTGVPLAYLVLALAVGLWSRGEADQSTTEGYIAGDRRIGLLVLYFIMGASIFSAFAFLGGPGWAYSRGAAALYLLAYLGFGMVPWYLFGPKAARLGRKLGFVTQAELVSERYNSDWLSALMAVVSIGAFIPYSVLQMKGVGYLLSEASSGLIPYWLAALLPFAVIAAYVFTSGMMGVGWSNVLQGVMMLTLAWAVGLYLPFELYGGIQPMFEQIAADSSTHLIVGEPEMPMLQYSSYIVVSVLGFVMWPHLFMRAFTARDAKTLKRTIAFYPTFAFVMIPVLFIGFAGVMYAPGLENADNILPYMVTSLEFSPWIVGFFFAGGLAAAMSSADSIVHAAASVFTRDFYAKVVNSDVSDHRQTRITQGAVVVTVAVAYYFAIVSDVSIVQLLAGAYGAIIQFLPLMIGVFFWHGATKEGAWSGLLLGAATTAYFTFIGSPPFQLHAGLWGLVVTSIVFVAVSMVTEVEDPETARKFIEESRP